MIKKQGECSPKLLLPTACTPITECLRNLGLINWCHTTPAGEKYFGSFIISIPAMETTSAHVRDNYRRGLSITFERMCFVFVCCHGRLVSSLG